MSLLIRVDYIEKPSQLMQAAENGIFGEHIDASLLNKET